MKTGLYSIRDNVAEEFGPLFSARNDGVAQRMYDAAVDKKGGVVHPDDYSLYRIGEWHTDTAEFDLLQHPFCVCSGVRIAEKAADDGKASS